MPKRARITSPTRLGERNSCQELLNGSPRALASETSVGRTTPSRSTTHASLPQRFQGSRTLKGATVGLRKGDQHPRWKGGSFVEKTTGYRRVSGFEQGYRYEHILVAERALGRALPRGAEVHHVNGNKTDNSSGNLVICQDRAYHKLIELRQRAIAACGNPNYRKCVYCHLWDDTTHMVHQSRRKANDCWRHRRIAVCRARAITELAHRDYEAARSAEYVQ